MTGNESIEIFGQNILNISGVSHTFYRFFLAQPQASLGISIMLTIIYLHNVQKEKIPYNVFFSGMLLGILFGVEASIGFMMVTWYGIMSIHDILIEKENRSFVIKNYILLWISAFIIYKSFFLVEMYGSDTSSQLQFGINWFNIFISPIYLTIEYGPILFFGIAGIIATFRKREAKGHWVYQIIILLGIAICFAFFESNPKHLPYALLKSSRVMPICFLALTGYFFSDKLLTKNKKLLYIVMMLLAFPSFFTDNYSTANISKPSSFIRISDFEATEWIKKNLPKMAVIQAESNHPGRDGNLDPLYSYSLIPIFSERQTAVGQWKTSEVAFSEKRKKMFFEIKKMFGTTEVTTAIRILKKYRIEYVYIGELECQLYPEGIKKFSHYKYFFEKIYSKNKVSILKVL